MSGPMLQQLLSGEKKNTDRKGAYRIATFVRWPGQIALGSVIQRYYVSPGLVSDFDGCCRRF